MEGRVRETDKSKGTGWTLFYLPKRFEIVKKNKNQNKIKKHATMGSSGTWMDGFSTKPVTISAHKSTHLGVLLCLSHSTETSVSRSIWKTEGCALALDNKLSVYSNLFISTFGT